MQCQFENAITIVYAVSSIHVTKSFQLKPNVALSTSFKDDALMGDGFDV